MISFHSRERTEPFKSDPEFIKECEVDEIALIPVCELFKLIMSIKNGKITIQKAQEMIKTCKGLFNYKEG